MHGCTITTRRSLPFARVLARSFLEHHPGGSFAALVLDDPDKTVGPGEPFDVIRPDETGIDETLFRRMAFLHSPDGLALGMQPWLLGELLRRDGGAVVYLAPASLVLESLEELRAHLERRPVVTARLLAGISPQALTPNDEDVLRVLGALDHGFIAVSQQAADSLEWWRSMISSHIVPAVDFRPAERLAAAGHVVVVDDPAAVLSFLNLRVPPSEGRLGGISLAGHPVRVFRFLRPGSGPDWPNPSALREHAAGLNGAAALARLCSDYADRLELEGYMASSEMDYSFEHLPSGPRIDDLMRWLYWYGLYEAEAGAQLPPDPFDAHAPSAFLDWLNETPDSTGLSRYLGRLLAEHPALREAFPRIPGPDTRRYLSWLRSDRRTVDLDPRLLPRNGQPADVDSRPIPPTSGLREGLNVIGPFDCAHGLGEASRQILGAIRDGGTPTATALSNVGISRPDLVFDVDGIEGCQYDMNLLCVNVNEIVDFARSSPPQLFEGRHSIGFWWWEVSKLSPDLLPAFDMVDEVWVGSEFVRDVLTAHTQKPVLAIPFAPEFPAIAPRPRRELGLSDGFLFLFVFDFWSTVERKNPSGLLRAFREAFSAGDGAFLVVKSVNGERDIASLERLRWEARGRPDILIVDDYLPAGLKDEWLASCDCYVSLHRSEGFGLTLAEAMAFGKPVIATAYSGNMTFMTEETSYLVPCELTTVPDNCGNGLYPGGAVWAEPDIGAAAALMRRVFECREEAGAVGARAAEHVRSMLSVRHAGDVVRQRLEEIRSSGPRMEVR